MKPLQSGVELKASVQARLGRALLNGTTSRDALGNFPLQHVLTNLQALRLARMTNVDTANPGCWETGSGMEMITDRSLIESACSRWAAWSNRLRGRSNRIQGSCIQVASTSELCATYTIGKMVTEDARQTAPIEDLHSGGLPGTP